jgi:hypothetical protein
MRRFIHVPIALIMFNFASAVANPNDRFIDLCQKKKWTKANDLLESIEPSRPRQYQEDDFLLDEEVEPNLWTTPIFVLIDDIGNEENVDLIVRLGMILKLLPKLDLAAQIDSKVSGTAFEHFVAEMVYRISNGVEVPDKAKELFLAFLTRDPVVTTVAASSIIEASEALKSWYDGWKPNLKEPRKLEEIFSPPTRQARKKTHRRERSYSEGDADIPRARSSFFIGRQPPNSEPGRARRMHNNQNEGPVGPDDLARLIDELASSGLDGEVFEF